MTTQALYLLIFFAVIGAIAFYIWKRRKSWLVHYKDGSSVWGGYAFVLVFILLTLSVTAGGYVSYLNYEGQFRDQAERQISAIAKLKMDGLVDWRKERLADVDFIYENPAFSDLAARYLNDPQDAEARAQLLSWLDKYEAFDQYDLIRLLDAQGAARLSLPDGLPAPSSAVAQKIPEARQSGKITFIDFYRNEQDRDIYLTILIPILDEQSKRVIAFVTLRIDPQAYLYPYLNQWPSDSDTAETLLVRREGDDVLFVNQLRFNPDAALNLRFPLTDTDTPAVKAALGQTGVAEGMDYHGDLVLADVRAVPDSPWFLVSKISTAEVYAPLRARLWETLGLVGMAIFMAGAGLTAIWRQQSVNFYRAQADAAVALRESEQRYKMVSELATDYIYKIGIAPDGKTSLDFVTDSFYAITGRSMNEARTAESWNNIFHPDDLGKVLEFMRTIIVTRQAGALECRSYVGDHQLRWIEIIARPEWSEQENRVTAIVGAVKDITARVQAEEELHHYLSELKVLYDNGLAINALWEPREIGGKIIETLSSNLAWHHIAIRLRRGETDELELIAFNQPDLSRQEAAEVEKRLDALVGKIGQGLSGWVVQTRQAIRTGNVQAHPQYVGIYSDIRSGIYMPLTVGDRAIGCITVESGEEDAFTEQDERLLATLAAQTAIAFENARLYRNVQQELQERERLMIELESKNRELESIVYVASHDLRSPLVNIQGFGRNLQKYFGQVSDALKNAESLDELRLAARPILVEHIPKALHFVEAGSAKMDSLISGLLHLSRVGRAQLQMEAVDMNSLMQNILDIMAFQVEKTGASIRFKPRLAECYGDKNQLSQVFGNLLDNAVKYRAPGRPLEIAISSEIKARKVTYSIADTGLGIAPEHQGKIWEIFHRLETDTAIPGEGLGLAIARRIIERHNGRIWVESTPGVGSCFRVELPLKI